MEGKAVHYKFWMEGEVVGENFEFKYPLPQHLTLLIEKNLNKTYQFI